MKGPGMTQVADGWSAARPHGDERFQTWWAAWLSERPQVARRWLWVAWALLGWNLWRHHRFFHDDAFITLRYARNLVATGRPEWNPGEPVEGFTSALHLLAVSAAGHWIQPWGWDWMDAARLVNFSALLVVLLAAWRMLGDASSGRRVPRAVGWCVLAVSSPLVVWSWGGLEAVLACAWVACGWMLLVRAVASRQAAQRPLSVGALSLAGSCLAMAVASRPDTVTLAAGTALALACLGWRDGGWRRGMAQSLAWMLPVLLVHGALMLWRWQTYHELAPNTYYAKVFGLTVGHRLHMGGLYLLRSLPDMAMLPAACAVCCMHRAWRADALSILAVAALLPFVAGIWWVGGDHMAVARFLVPALPVVALLSTRLLLQQAHPEASSAGGARRVLLVGLVVCLAWPLVRPGMRRDPAAWAGQLVGQHLARQWPAGTLVAVNTAGAPAFFAPQLRFIDMLGLNDAHIARRQVPRIVRPMQQVPGHAKGDGAYVLSRQPDVIVTGFAEGQQAEQSWFVGDMELADLPEFRRCYRLERVGLVYDEAFARLGRYPSNPMPFTYYRRICPKAGAAHVRALTPA